MTQLFLHDKPPAYCDGWQLARLWTAGASVVAPSDHGPELAFAIASPGPAAAEYYTEATVEIVDTYRVTSQHPLRLRLRRVRPDGAVEQVGSVRERYPSGGAWDLSIPFDSPIEQATALCYRLHVEGPWGIGAVAGALQIVRTYIDCQPAPSWPGDAQP